MGNWRTVTIVGRCPPEEREALRERLTEAKGFEDGTMAQWRARVYPISIGTGLFGLGDWLGQHEDGRVDASGNLGERDYDPEDVHRALEACLEVAPGLRVLVHCGGDYEADECLTHVEVCDARGEGHVVTTTPGCGERVRGASAGEAAGRLLANLTGMGPV